MAMNLPATTLDVAPSLPRQLKPLAPPQFPPQPRVPAFLNKLHALVNDPQTNEYVRWNDIGTSFIIPNSQLMAENVLPRSFKTINFASFVRQLNMYGFHKVPHLNDGALHTENAPELWEFTNEHFTRDDPDLPSIVQKKIEAEKARSAKRHGTPEPNPRQAPYPAIEAPSNVAPTTDMTVVYEEIRNIKRFQNSIVGELKRLKTDNEALWTEAAEARARYDQQQATINKMFKFLSTMFSPSKSNAGTLPSRNRGLLTGPSTFEELSDDRGDAVLTPEAQETGARELSNLFETGQPMFPTNAGDTSYLVKNANDLSHLFGGAQPILPVNAGDASWWQNLVKSGSDNGMFNLSTPSYTPPTDHIAPYEPPPVALNQHRSSLATMEHAVNQTDQSIGRISNVLGVEDWDDYHFGGFQNTDGFAFDPAVDTQNANTQPEYRFEDFIRNTDENGTILDQNEEETDQEPASTGTRFESLSRETSPKPRELNTNDKNDTGTRKRTRSQTSTQGELPLQKRIR